MENTGLYQKYDVRRRDGQPDKADAAYFTLDVVNDPHALPALRCYRMSCEGTLPELAQALFALEAELMSGQRDGPMVQALRVPRS